MTGYFYKFAKKLNSTARPSGGASLAIELKEQSSVISPTLLLKQLSFPDYNYCYLPEFGRYYYINDPVWKNGIWQLSCTVDAMATYKSQIGSRDAYILRASAESDGSIFDNLYPAKTDYTTQTQSGSLWWDATNLSTGYYIIGLIGKWTDTDPQAGAITYVWTTAQGFNNFMLALFADNLNWYKSTAQPLGIEDSLAKMIFDPFQYIRSVRWVPEAPPSQGSSFPTLRIGWWTVSSDPGFHLVNSEPFTIFEQEFTLPKHPKSGTRGSYLNSSKFSEYTLMIPTIGIVALPADEIADADQINITYRADVISGDARCQISASKVNSQEDPKQLKMLYASYGLSVELAQAETTLSQLTVPAQNAATFGASPVSAIANTITSFTDLLSPPIDYVGHFDSFLNMAPPLLCSLTSTFYDVVDEYNTDNGRPLCKVRKPANLGGYMQIYNSDIEIPGTEQEQNIIRGYLEEGFFYE